MGSLWASTGKPLSSVPSSSDTAPDALESTLASRVRAADAARESGNAATIEATHKLVIATALRMLAQLRSAEHAYPLSIGLYQQSLQYEPQPTLHAEIADAALYAGQFDLAVSEAQKALALAPHAPVNYRLLGQAYLGKQDFAHAAETLTRAAEQKPDIELYYSIAICWLSAGGATGQQKADATFAKMKAMAGDSGSLHVLFGRAYRDANKMPEAVREFEKAIALDPSTPHAHYFLGLAHMAMNEWKPTPETETEFQKELQYHPRDFLANYMLGNIASEQRDFAKANPFLQAAREIDPSSPEPVLYLGLNAYAQGDAKTAEPLLRKAVELTGSDESRNNYQIRRAYVDLGRILASSGREQEGDVFLAKARELQNQIMRDTQQRATKLLMSEGASSGTMAAMVPLDKAQEAKSAPLSDATASVDSSSLKDAKLSAEQLNAAKTQDTSLRRILAQSFNELATAQAIQHDYAAALPNFQQAERWDPETPDLYKNLGLCAYRLKDFAEASRALATAVKADPDKAALRAMLGMSYFGEEKYGDAATSFYPLGEPGMDDKEVGYAWAASLARVGDMKHATEVLERYQQQPLPDDAKLLVGQLWTEIGDYGKAVDELHAALAAEPGLRRAHYFAGLADIRWEHWTDARAELSAELATSPGDADAAYELGFVDLQESKNDDAQKRFEAVVAAHPDYGNAQYELGKMLLDQGKVQAALPHLETAAKMLPEKDYVHYQLQAAYRKAARPNDADRELALYQELKAKARPHLDQGAAQGQPQNR